MEIKLQEETLLRTIKMFQQFAKEDNEKSREYKEFSSNLSSWFSGRAEAYETAITELEHLLELGSRY